MDNLSFEPKLGSEDSRKKERIKELGYHLVVMWEGDWNPINHSISILQRKIRK